MEEQGCPECGVAAEIDDEIELCLAEAASPLLLPHSSLNGRSHVGIPVTKSLGDAPNQMRCFAAVHSADATKLPHSAVDMSLIGPLLAG
jgi:hypothetical protein